LVSGERLRRPGFFSLGDLGAERRLAHSAGERPETRRPALNLRGPVL